jgi:hypothetical protein
LRDQNAAKNDDESRLLNGTHPHQSFPPSALDVYELSIDMHDELYDVMFPFVNHPESCCDDIKSIFRATSSSYCSHGKIRE